MAKPGRPSSYSPEIAASICAGLSTGKLLRQVCAKPGMPSESAVFSWLSQHPAFAEQYTRAKELQVDAIAADTLEIADTIKEGKKRKTVVDAKGQESVEEQTGDMVERARLMVDTRKWLLAKMAPKKYGDRLELAGDKDNPIASSLTIEFVKSPELGAAVTRQIEAGKPPEE